MYAQLVNDDEGKTLVASDNKQAGEVELPEGLGGKRAVAYRVGRAIAEAAKAKGVAKVVFDRNGYLYHGRVAALADAARDAGLDLGAKKVVEAKKAPAKTSGKKPKKEPKQKAAK